MTEPATSTVHATCIRVGPFGVLITGPSGSGKSDLALRLIDQPGRGAGGTVMDAALIADDRVVLTVRNGELAATAPGAIKGLMEIRSVGVVAVPAETSTRVDLVVTLAADGDLERIPDFRTQTVDCCGIELPELRIDPFEASAPAKVRALVAALHGGGMANEVPAGDGE